jgi:type II secretory pathway predicted ATPase ExeA
MYESFYGLTGKPFQLNPDPSFYFGSRGHKRAFAYWVRALPGEGFIIITGEIGAGKTTIVRSLQEQLDPARSSRRRWRAPSSTRTTCCEPSVSRLNCRSATSTRPCCWPPGGFLCQLATEKKRALLIDEAQNLTNRAVEELRMLSNFQLGTRRCCKASWSASPSCGR